jgi:2-keto-3-deoxy-L-rhamnonate aldolase RhmA
MESGAIGTWTSLSDPASAETAASAGFDFVVIDTEHSPLGLETVTDCVRAAENGGAETVVRTPWNDPVRIKRLLDIGPSGLLVPMVDTAEEAETAVEAMRYPPEGIRGVAGARATGYGRNFEEYVTEGHRDVTLIPQLETETAVENADAIAAVEGVDALFVGPADLSASLGIVGQFDHPDLHDAIGTVLSAGESADVPVGTLGVDRDAIDALGTLDFDYLIAGTDASHLRAGQTRSLSAAEDALR